MNTVYCQDIPITLYYDCLDVQSSVCIERLKDTTQYTQIYMSNILRYTEWRYILLICTVKFTTFAEQACEVAATTTL